MKDAFKVFIAFFIPIYIMIAMGFFTYYSWQYSKKNGFVKYLLLGEVVPAGKALAWPYFAFFYTEEKEKRNPSMEHFERSLSLERWVDLQATKLMDHPDSVKLKQIADTLRVIVSEAEMVNIDTLNKIYPTFGDHYQSEFTKAMKMAIQAYKDKSIKAGTTSDSLNRQWYIWFSETASKISY